MSEAGILRLDQSSFCYIGAVVPRLEVKVEGHSIFKQLSAPPSSVTFEFEIISYGTNDCVFPKVACWNLIPQSYYME